MTSGTDDEVEANPMVSQAIKPFLISVVVRAKHQQKCKALVDSDCPCCLMNVATADSIGVGVRRLAHPIRFEQMDGSLLGGQLATHVTELLTLQIGVTKNVSVL